MNLLAATPGNVCCMAPKSALKKRPALDPPQAKSALKKRPAAEPAAEPLDPQKAHRWAESVGDAQGNDSETEADHDKGPDTRPITKKQRHLFTRAMAAMPGTPGSLPPDVRKQHQEFMDSAIPGKQAKLNAVVNSIIPRSAGYGAKIDFTEPTSRMKFQQYFVETKHDKTFLAMTESEVIGRLGGGDVGRCELPKALAKGDVMFKNNMYVWRNEVMTESHIERHGGKVEQSEVYGVYDESWWASLKDTYADTGWL